MSVPGRIIPLPSGAALATGKACLLHVLWAYWVATSAKNTSFLGAVIKRALAVAYDASVGDGMWAECFSAKSSGPIEEWTNSEIKDDEFPMTRYLMREFGPGELCVLRLGHAERVLKYVGRRGKEGRAARICARKSAAGKRNMGGEVVLEEDGVAWEIQWERSSEIVCGAFGLILLREKSELWRRIGICWWQDSNETGNELVDWEA